MGTIGERSGRGAEPDAFADRGLAGPETPRARFVHDRDRCRARAVRSRERPSGQERDAERPEIVGGHIVTADAGRVGAIDTPIRKKDRAARTAGEGRAAVHRRRLDAGHRLDAREQALERRRSVGGRVARCWRAHPERQHVVGHESGSPVLDAREALNQQSRHREQQTGERHFADDEHRQGAALPAAAAIVLLECRRELGTRRLERRHEREQHGGPERHREREHQHAWIERRPPERGDQAVVVAADGHDLGCRPRERLRAPGGKSSSARAGDRGHQQPFGEQLLNQAAAARPDGQPHRHLTPPHPRAREKQARHVDAGDEEDARGGPEQHESGSPHCGVDARVANRHRGCAPHGVRRSHAGETRPDSRELRVRPPKRGAVLQPGDNGDELLRGREVLGVRQARGHRRRNPELGLAAQSREAVRQDADDRQRHLVDAKRAADDRPIAGEPPLPEPRADDRHGLCARHRVFFGAEDTACDRRHPQRLKIAGRCHFAVDLFRIAVPARRQQRRRERSDALERRHRRLKLDDMRPRPAEARQAVTRCHARGEKNDEAIRLGERHRPEQRPIHHAEHRRRRADAEREREDGHCGHAAHASEGADGVADILEHGIHQA